MNNDDLAALERLLAEATRGPWEADEYGYVMVREPIQYIFTGDTDYYGRASLADAAAIVALFNAAPQLLREVKAGRELIELTRPVLAKGHGGTVTWDNRPIRAAFAAYDAATGGE